MDRLFMTVTPYAMSHELHGCYREAMQKVTFDQSPCFITKGTSPFPSFLASKLVFTSPKSSSPLPFVLSSAGWTMGGQTKYLQKVCTLYEYLLNKTLDLGTHQPRCCIYYYFSLLVEL
jgi:hypothetical protein